MEFGVFSLEPFVLKPNEPHKLPIRFQPSFFLGTAHNQHLKVFVDEFRDPLTCKFFSFSCVNLPLIVHCSVVSMVTHIPPEMVGVCLNAKPTPEFYANVKLAAVTSFVAILFFLALRFRVEFSPFPTQYGTCLI
jgi:hypothetical protein